VDFVGLNEDSTDLFIKFSLYQSMTNALVGLLSSV